MSTLTVEKRSAALAGRPHRATVPGGLLVIASHPLRFVVGKTQAWLSFAAWLTDLAGWEAS